VGCYTFILLVLAYKFYTPMFKDASTEEIEAAMLRAWESFPVYSQYSLADREAFLVKIAEGLEQERDKLVEIAGKETNLTATRLNNELSRTIFQLKSYGAFCRSGQWMDIRIDTAAESDPPKPDLRKMLIPLGPVVVFGASNFPFAYSTAGGDTACALAAGCPVIVKAHPAHAGTSQMVAAVVIKVIADLNMPEGIFTHLFGADSAVGEMLVKHPFTKAVGFTGSFAGGKQIFDWGNQRAEPIPVFAEMSSVNPVFLLPGKMKSGAEDIARMYAASITLGVGQFCTNPGILVALDNEDLITFRHGLVAALLEVEPEKMLHEGIAKNFELKKATALAQEDVQVIYESKPTAGPGPLYAAPVLATTTASAFMQNPILMEEVFGPYSIIVRCSDMEEMLAVAHHLRGQLTASILATENEILKQHVLVAVIKNLCGRLIFNGVPTGVEVALSMQHGGPYPASTDSRFTSVGADGIKRFARPIAYQSWPDNLLPDELKNTNPLNIWRTVNNEPSLKALPVNE
jgi:NADP-dependent aldehyde dehydrogenase